MYCPKGFMGNFPLAYLTMRSVESYLGADTAQTETIRLIEREITHLRTGQIYRRVFECVFINLMSTLYGIPVCSICR
jgi:hypothetical protein